MIFQTFKKKINDSKGAVAFIESSIIISFILSSIILLLIISVFTSQLILKKEISFDNAFLAMYKENTAIDQQRLSQLGIKDKVHMEKVDGYLATKVIVYEKDKVSLELKRIDTPDFIRKTDFLEDLIKETKMKRYTQGLEQRLTKIQGLFKDWK